MQPYIHGTDPLEQNRLSRLNALTNESFIAFLDLNGVESVLDVGCGLGILAAEIARRRPDIEVFGVDSSQDQLGRMESPPPNLHLSQADAQKLPFESSRFDLVYCRYLLEHVPSPLRVLQEMLRVLRPGKRAFVQENNILANILDPECPNFAALWRKFAELQSRLGGDALIGRRLFPLLKQVGFLNIELSMDAEVHWSGSSGFAPWIENLIANVNGVAAKLQELKLATEQEVISGIDDLRRMLSRNDASAFFYWNRVTGQKP